MNTRIVKVSVGFVPQVFLTSDYWDVGSWSGVDYEGNLVHDPSRQLVDCVNETKYDAETRILTYKENQRLKEYLRIEREERERKRIKDLDLLTS